VSAPLVMLTSCRQRCYYHSDPAWCVAEYDKKNSNAPPGGGGVGVGGAGGVGGGGCSSDAACGPQDDPCRSHSCNGGTCVHEDLENAPVGVKDALHDCYGPPQCKNGELTRDEDPDDHPDGNPTKCMEYACVKAEQGSDTLEVRERPIAKYNEDATCNGASVCDGKGGCGLKEGEPCNGDDLACASNVCDDEENKCKRGMFDECKKNDDCGSGSDEFTCKINSLLDGTVGICLKNPGKACGKDEHCSTNFCNNEKCDSCNTAKHCKNGLVCTPTGLCKHSCVTQACPPGFMCTEDGYCGPKCSTDSSSVDFKPCGEQQICVSGYCIAE
jgi:hypothetical protein